MVIQMRLTALGYTDTPMEAAIRRYQSEVLGFRSPDSLIEPEGATLRALRSGRRANPTGNVGAQRPSGSAIWAAYSRVAYGQLSGEEVWKLVGGRIGRTYGKTSTQEAQNSCACRLSYALNHGGDPIGSGPGAGKNDDGMRYITSARMLTAYLTSKYGKPDAWIQTNDEAKAFMKTLKPGEVAVFAGVHHVGLMRDGYADHYVFTAENVMPVSAWKLP